MTKKKILIIASILFVAGVIAIFVTGKKGNNDVNSLLLSGNVEVTEVDLGFTIPGKVERLSFDEGDTVEEGVAAASLEKSELEGEVMRSKARLFEARERYGALKAGSRPQEIREADAEVSLSKAELEKAEKDFERAENLLQREIMSRAQYESYKKSYDVALYMHNVALERKNLVLEGPRKEEVKAQGYVVDEAEAALKVAEAKLQDATIRSTSQGVIIKKYVEEGETVSAGVPVYTIGDLKNPWIMVYVKEDKLGLVKLGQRAEVTVDSYPGKIYEGKVTFISSEAEFTPKTIQTFEERVKLVFGVEVSLENPEGELKPGMPADVLIILK